MSVLPQDGSRPAVLAEGLRARLDAIPGVTVRDQGAQRCAITTFTVDGVDPSELQARLRAERVNVSVSVATSSQLDLPHRGLDAVIRASLHSVNTEEGLDRFATLVGRFAGD